VNHIALEQMEERPPSMGKHLDTSSLAGSWINTNAKPAMIRHIQIDARDGQLMMRVAGSEAGLPEDWGTVAIQPFAETASAIQAMAFSALFDLAGVESLLQGYVVKGVLVIVSFTRVKDGRDRSSSFGKEFFYRVS
jgi:hypothetical protein